MSRNNIFEIIERNSDTRKEVDRINSLFIKEELVSVNYSYGNEKRYTVKDYVSTFCFRNWKNRGHCFDFDDFLETVDYVFYYNSARGGNANAFLAFIEIVCNCWKMANISVNQRNNVYVHANFDFMLDIMTDCLSHYNHKVVYDESTERVLVIEDNPAVTAVAEIVEPNVAMSILKYNHHTLHGDIDKKKTILFELGAKLEPKKKSLSEMDSTLAGDVFFMLNNLNIRHNNVSPGSKNYKEYVSQLSSEALENWYDELYQMMLLAFLELDQKERKVKVKTLKDSIDGGRG